MLILSRRAGETVRIGEDITVTVLEINGNQIRLGFEAPKEVAVHREEIYQRIKAEEEARDTLQRCLPALDQAEKLLTA